MASDYTIPAETRTDVGKGASRRLRRAGRIPAVVYGGDRDAVSITVDHDYLYHLAEQEAFHVSILELTAGDKKQKVILRDLQRHAFKPLIFHADFLRISDDHKLRISVPVHFTNEEHSPAGRTAGVVISHLMTEVEIEALPGDLPEYLAVDLAELEPGEGVMLSELGLPEGVIVPALEYGDEDDDVTLVSAQFVRASQGTGALAAEADAAMGEAEDELAEEEAADEEEAEAGEEGEGEDAEAESESGESGEEDDDSKEG